MMIEQSPEYPTLKDKLEDEFLEMVEYSVNLYLTGIITNENGELKVTDYSKVDMLKLDLDAVRWWTGNISVEEYIKSIAMYYKRA